jgi:predicted nucleic acid-binding protein
MGVILDSSVVIAAERRANTIEKFIESLVNSIGDQDAALSSVGLTELIHGIYRATDPQIRSRRGAFIRELLSDFTVYPYTSDTAMLAGKIGGEQQASGISIPFSDLLIGATALSLGFPVLTFNLRHFRLIPGLTVLPFSAEGTSQESKI